MDIIVQKRIARRAEEEAHEAELLKKRIGSAYSRRSSRQSIVVPSRDVSPNSRRDSHASRRSSRDHGVGDARNSANIVSSAQRLYGGTSQASNRPSSRASSRRSSVKSLKEPKDTLKEEYVNTLKEILNEPRTEPIRKSSAPDAVRPPMDGVVRDEKQIRCSSLPLPEIKRTHLPPQLTHRSELAESCKSECLDDVFYI